MRVWLQFFTLNLKFKIKIDTNIFKNYHLLHYITTYESQLYRYKKSVKFLTFCRKTLNLKILIEFSYRENLDD